MSLLLTLTKPEGESFDPNVPLGLPGLLSWWDASDASTVTTSGGKVDQINDKSGNANHATQIMPLLRPDYTLGGSSNGRNVISSTGSNYLDTPANSFPSGEMSIYFAVNVKDESRIIQAGLTNTLILDVTGASDPRDITQAWGGDSLVASNEYTLNNEKIISIHFDGLSNRSTYFDRSQVAIDSSLFSTNSNSPNYIMSPTVDYVGDIMEIIVYDVNHDTSQRQTIENYFLSKWNF